MSSENIEKFYAKAYSEPELGAALNNLLNPQDMVTSIVALGEAHGCSFTNQETTEFLAAMSARNDNGELDDLQLEAVAGGKFKPTRPPINANSFGGLAGMLAGAPKV